MAEKWSMLKGWWESLALREQRAVILGAGCLCLFIVYAGIASPFLNHVAGLRQRIVKEQKILLKMQAADKEMQQPDSALNIKVTSVMVLMGLLQKQVDQSELAQSLIQLRQVTNDAVEIQFKKIEFSKLIRWLILLRKANDMTIVQMSVNAENTVGMVDANLTLSIAKV